MNALPQLNLDVRAPRLKFADITHAVLRFEDGRRTKGQLEVISLTGGMLFLAKTVAPDARVKLMFLSSTGPVLGTAEMLQPVSRRHQPFRFVELEPDDERRLRESVQPSSRHANNEQEWIEKYRATLDRNPPRRRFLRPLLAAATLAMLCLGSAIYIFSMHLK